MLPFCKSFEGMAGEGDSVEALDDNDFEDDSDSDEFNEVEMADESLTCLFCTRSYRNINDAICHCKMDHNFDILKLKYRHHMDCYGFIKLVNYIRLTHADPLTLAESDGSLWESEEYLKPVQADDPWLMVDFDDLEDSSQKSHSGYHVVNAENGLVTLSEQHFAELQRTIQELSARVQEKEAVIGSLIQDLEQMRITTRELITDNNVDVTQPLGVGLKRISLNDDEGYFNTYSHFSIHHEMLSDHVRTSSYQDAILKNSASLAGKTVLDLGCGSGILSMFAATAGAQRVIGIDQSDIIYHAMDIVRENNLSDKIELLRGRIEDTSLPVDKVDVLISEWMGYFLLFEGMLDSLLYTRDHYLKPGGVIMPNRFTINLVGVADEARYEQLVGFWSNVYGFHMSCLQREVFREPTIELVPNDKIATTVCQLFEIDVNSCTPQCSDFSAEFQFEALQDSKLTALAGYFDVFFDVAEPVSFSTGPAGLPTHWKQTVFFLPETIFVNRGDKVNGKLLCRRDFKDLRSLQVTIIICDKRYKYILS